MRYFSNQIFRHKIDDKVMEKNNMSKAPEHFKPFDRLQAKAGAPFYCKSGDKATVTVWDGKKIIGHVQDKHGDHHAMQWTPAGDAIADEWLRGCDLVMLPLGMCEGKPVFVGDKLEQRDRHNQSWVALDAQIGHKDFDDSRWLSPYPKTRVAKHVLAEFFSTTKPYADDCVDLANYAIECAIKSGDVVPAAMLEAVAKEVQKAYTHVPTTSGPGAGVTMSDADFHARWGFANPIGGGAGGGGGSRSGNGGPTYTVDLAAIIKRVKEGQ